MAAGLPVITTNVGALAEAVVDGQTGIVVPLNDSTAMASAMARLSVDGNLRAMMSTNARERAQDKFDARKNYKKLVDKLLQAKDWK